MLENRTQQLTFSLCKNIEDIEESSWDACAGTDNPFIGYRFLKALETSGSATAATGWMPLHATITDGNGELVGCTPMYLKSHSQGEYVFDHSWAQAFQNAGGQYYPKLLIGVPFTPVTGARFLIRRDQNTSSIFAALLDGVIRIAKENNLSSINVNFVTNGEYKTLGAHGFLQRTGEQFHWQNDGYYGFDDFLSALSSRKRKLIKRERRTSQTNEVRILRATGDQISPQHWDSFYNFYLDTSYRKWGQAYLNREFFEILGQTMADKVLLVLAQRDGRIVAGALNMIGQDTLFGRYWGCVEEHKFLHFEICYYQAIEFAIENALARVEAGAQGIHKLSRGYLPYHTYSAHWIRNAHFREAVEKYLEDERLAVSEGIDLLGHHSPFRKLDSN